MWPILGCSIAALAISTERCMVLKRSRVAPPRLVNKAVALLSAPNKQNIENMAQQSLLGSIFAAGLAHVGDDMEAVTESMEEAGRHVIHTLEKYLSALSTIAMVAPLLGLLGTVFGLITVFSALMETGGGDSQMLSGGIASALLSTAAGLLVAIPATAAHRAFERHIESLAIDLEKQSTEFLQAIRRFKLALY